GDEPGHDGVALVRPFEGSNDLTQEQDVYAVGAIERALCYANGRLLPRGSRRRKHLARGRFELIPVVGVQIRRREAVPERGVAGGEPTIQHSSQPTQAARERNGRPGGSHGRSNLVSSGCRLACIAKSTERLITERDRFTPGARRGGGSHDPTRLV